MHPQVLLRALLDSPATINAPAWVEWISNAPVEARDIRVEGWYGSFATLVILNVSIGTWHSLSDNPAISFLGYVTTQNLASSLNLSAAQIRVADVSFLGISDPEPARQPLHSFDPIRRDTGGSTVSRPSNPEGRPLDHNFVSTATDRTYSLLGENWELLLPNTDVLPAVTKETRGRYSLPKIPGTPPISGGRFPRKD